MKSKRPANTRTHGPLLTKVRAASQHITWFLGTRCTQTVPLTFIVGYPKSGTTWATQLVADYLQLPFPRFSILPITFPAVVHGHQPIRDDYPQAMYIVRDPRDTMISRYFSTVRYIDKHYNSKPPRRYRQMLPNPNYHQQLHDNLPMFIEYHMTRERPHGLNWAEHVRTYLDRNNPRVGLLRYEQLLNNGPAHLAQALEQMTGEPADLDRVQQAIDRFSFTRQAKRKPGEEDRSSFLRKGQAGEWKNTFTREAAEVLDRYCGQAMIEMQYADDHDWVRQCE